MIHALLALFLLAQMSTAAPVLSRIEPAIVPRSDCATALPTISRHRIPTLNSISRSRLESNNIKLILAVRPLSIPSDRCWRLGMIVYELITNSARHAFQGQKARFGPIALRGKFCRMSGV